MILSLHIKVLRMLTLTYFVSEQGLSGRNLQKDIVKVWLSALFSGAERYKRRLSRVEKIEKGFLKK